jgi:hypothetical protein
MTVVGVDLSVLDLVGEALACAEEWNHPDERYHEIIRDYVRPRLHEAQEALEKATGRLYFPWGPSDANDLEARHLRGLPAKEEA